ncbi:MAG: MurR/RpiR family transcriptional regulator [Bacilli bacterium]
MNITSLSEKFGLEQLEESILKYLYAERTALKKLGVRRVAKENFTSTTTVYKLATKLGFSGYSDMIHHLYDLFHGESPQSDLRAPRKDLDDIVRLSRDSFHAMITHYYPRQLMVVGFGLSAHIANYMNESFILRGYRSLSNVHLQLISVQQHENVLLIIISESGSTPRLVEIATSAKNNGLKIMSFVGRPDCPLAQLSDVSIPVGNFDPLRKDVRSANLFFPGVLYVFEQLIGDLETV